MVTPLEVKLCPMVFFQEKINASNLATYVVLSHDQCNVRLEKRGLELVWICYRLEKGFSFPMVKSRGI